MPDNFFITVARSIKFEALNFTNWVWFCKIACLHILVLENEIIDSLSREYCRQNVGRLDIIFTNFTQEPNYYAGHLHNTRFTERNSRKIPTLKDISLSMDRFLASTSILLRKYEI